MVVRSELFMLKWLLPVAVCLLLAGCGGGTANRTERIASSLESVYTVQEPGPPQAAPDDDAATREVTRPGARATDQKGASQKRPSARRSLSRELRPAGRDQEGSREGLSLFVRPDDGENLNSLLTEDNLKRFDIPIVLNDAVQYYVRFFSVERRKLFAAWLRRSRRYVPMIKDILREHGLPEDLVYLAMIESGFNPRAYSPAKACGPWQFIYETGDRYGLQVTHWVDERRDPEKSTVAAALYLKDLFNQFGCWYLAAAAYNAGEKRVERSIEKHETSDFWELTRYNALPKETREYIPRLLAAAIVAKNPDRFGFGNIVSDEPITFARERVPGGMPLALLARAAQTDEATMRGLNPELLTGITPPDAGDYVIKVPQYTRRDRFREEVRAATDGGGRVQGVTSYTFKRRDSVKSVLKRYNIDYRDLLLVNSCGQDLRAKAGSVVYIPRFDRVPEPVQVATNVAPPREERRAEAPAPDEEPIRKGWISPTKVAAKPAVLGGYHMVKKGESLKGISKKYGMSVAALKEMNGLKNNKVRPNTRLQLTARAAARDSAPAPAPSRVARQGQRDGGEAPMQAGFLPTGLLTARGGKRVDDDAGSAKRTADYRKPARTASYQVVKKKDRVPEVRDQKRTARAQAPKLTSRAKKNNSRAKSAGSKAGTTRG
jgi:membrane-bound lytic murein transglycosylase D